MPEKGLQEKFNTYDDDKCRATHNQGAQQAQGSLGQQEASVKLGLGLVMGSEQIKNNIHRNSMSKVWVFTAGAGAKLTKVWRSVAHAVGHVQ